MSYEDIAEITQVSLGTVKSRLTRGREALKQRLLPFIRQCGSELGLRSPEASRSNKALPGDLATGGREVEVTS
jgi:hypothetical protein